MEECECGGDIIYVEIPDLPEGKFTTKCDVCNGKYTFKNDRKTVQVEFER